MDHLKWFLDSVCSNNEKTYKYEQVENLAEIYYANQPAPLAMIEWNNSLGSFIIRFRIGISSRDVASLTRDMTEVDSCLVFDEDFIIDQQYGYLYGEDATKAFLKGIQDNIEQAQFAAATDGAIYISNEPIIAAGSDYPSKTKIEKYWGDDF